MHPSPALGPCSADALTHIAPIPLAGRGVLALQRVSSGTLVLESRPPAASVIFQQYRKEVCARCFHYALGRTLAVRHASTGKFFCSEDCRHEWLEGEGELGVRAWECLHSFLRARVGRGGDGDECLPDRGAKPGRDEIEAAWKRVSGAESHLRGARGKIPPPATANRTRTAIDPDTLTYLLSATLSHHHNPQTWSSSLSNLSQNSQPYHSTHDLATHTSSHQTLTTLLPKPLLLSLTPETSHLAVTAASHNSFGIRGGEDGEEYMGYALFPDASYFNHSCRPNLAKVRVERRWVFTAHRDIDVGEECCITYLGGEEKDMDVEERRARLREHWGFVCMCVRCCEESRSS